MKENHTEQKEPNNIQSEKSQKDTPEIQYATMTYVKNFKSFEEGIEEICEISFSAEQAMNHSCKLFGEDYYEELPDPADISNLREKIEQGLIENYPAETICGDNYTNYTTGNGINFGWADQENGSIDFFIGFEREGSISKSAQNLGFELIDEDPIHANIKDTRKRLATYLGYEHYSRSELIAKLKIEGGFYVEIDRSRTSNSGTEFSKIFKYSPSNQSWTLCQHTNTSWRGPIPSGDGGTLPSSSKNINETPQNIIITPENIILKEESYYNGIEQTNTTEYTISKGDNTWHLPRKYDELEEILAELKFPEDK